MIEDIIINILKGFYKVFKYLKKVLFKSLLFNISLILFIVLVPGLYYIHLFNPFNLTHIFPRTLIIVPLLIVFFTIIVLTIGIKDDNNNLNLIKINYKKYFKLTGLFVLLLFLFLMLYHVSSNMLYYSSNKSTLLSIVIVFLLLGIIYNKFFKKSNDSNNEEDAYKLKNFLIDVIFYIPCIIINIIDYIKKDFKNTPSSTFVMLYIIIGIFILYFIIPLFKYIKKNRKEIVLLDKPVPLTSQIIKLNHDELKNKVIESRPFVQKALLKNNEKLQKHLNYFINSSHESSYISSINKYENRRIIYNSPNEDIAIKELSDCYNKEISCIDDNLYCINKDNADNKTIIKNFYNMYEKCKTHEKGSLFSKLFSDPKSKVTFYDSASKDNITTLKKWCESKHPNENVAVTCLPYNNESKSNVISAYDKDNIEYTNTSLLDTEVYACTLLNKTNDDTNSKYNIIRGYNDVSNDEVTFDCSNNYIEGFNSEIHTLDKNLNDVDLYLSLSGSEKEILNSALNEGNSVLQNQLNNLSNIKDKNTFILEYLSNNEYYGTLMNKINELNNKKNDFIVQETSDLIELINRTNKIYKYNYHYGLSFWIYFDSSIIKDKGISDMGFIMHYSNNPYIYFDYDTEELIIEVEDCSSANLLEPDEECNFIPIYKTKDILYQKWNHFIINYNYGTLDIFINNNLVATRKNVSPYIRTNENNLIFGNKTEPLQNCGICNIKYYEKPLNLIDIKNIYNKKNNPCK